MAAYARQAKDSELIQYATEIKVRAERRCGELLRATAERGERATREQHGRGGQVASCDQTPPTLADMGLSKSESSRYQQLAAMPAEHFETAVATAQRVSVGPPGPVQQAAARTVELMRTAIVAEINTRTRLFAARDTDSRDWFVLESLNGFKPAIGMRMTGDLAALGHILVDVEGHGRVALYGQSGPCTRILVAHLVGCGLGPDVTPPGP